jgi:hypothetical protein
MDNELKSFSFSEAYGIHRQILKGRKRISKAIFAASIRIDQN